tara:strand:- start:3859 stop:4248 length:390 start_codon:yes stop_codon:yes gene_type:complete
MNDKDVELVVQCLLRQFKIPESEQRRLRNSLKALQLSGEGAKPVRYSWIEEARVVAKRIAQNNGEVTIEDVLAELPLPDDCDARIVGGVFKHPSFVRTGNRVLRAKDRRYKTVGVFALARRYEPVTDWD